MQPIARFLQVSLVDWNLTLMHRTVLNNIDLYHLHLEFWENYLLLIWRCLGVLWVKVRAGTVLVFKVLKVVDCQLPSWPRQTKVCVQLGCRKFHRLDSRDILKIDSSMCRQEATLSKCPNRYNHSIQRYTLSSCKNSSVLLIIFLRYEPRFKLAITLAEGFS